MTATEEQPASGSFVSRSLRLRSEAVPGAVAELRHAACEFARRNSAEPAVVDDIALAVSEAATNAVKYGYPPGQTGIVRLSAAAGDGWLEFRVSDEGHGFQEGRSDGLGLGLPTIAQVSAEMEVSQTSEGTEVRMRFPLPSQ